MLPRHFHLTREVRGKRYGSHGGCEQGREGIQCVTQLVGGTAQPPGPLTVPRGDI